MKRAMLLLILLGTPDSARAQQDARAFDGTWDVTVACAQQPGGVLPYTYKFVAEVKEGVLHAQHGSPGSEASLTLDGKIAPDGSALLEARGVTGNPSHNTRRGASNRPYSYRVAARFEGAKGTGRRLEVRACDVTFVKR